MSWNIGKISKLVAVRWHFPTIKIPPQLWKPRLLKTRKLLQLLSVETIMKAIIPVVAKEKVIVSLDESKLMAQFEKIRLSDI